MKYLFYIILAFSLYGCCQVATIDSGPLPESALRFVPYLNDSIYSFQHSDGHLIQFQTSRDTHEDWQRCADCCFEYRYETNATNLLPDHPIFEIYLEISNLDTAFLFCDVLIGNNNFFIPTDLTISPNFEVFDSVLIDSISYYDVFKLGDPQHPYVKVDYIKVDSLYYNYEHGILKILMHNGEYYKILQ